MIVKYRDLINSFNKITSVPLKVVVTEQVRSIINWDYC